jgi:hypothetical protein
MQGPAAPLQVTTSLRLGERVVARSSDGLLTAEYLLFDVNDAVLRATDPVTVREAGYMTTAREALGRLANEGITPDLADDAARSMGPGVVASYARGASARSVDTRLGAHEIFDGAIYSASAGQYEGAWLDLRALTTALSVPSAPVVLQALHLAVTLSEVAPAMPLLLSTANATRSRRPGERTHVRVVLSAMREVLAALRRLPPNPEPVKVEPGSDRRLRRALLARVRERMSADSPPRLRSHLEALEAALSTRTMPLGPLADPELRALERQLASGDVRGVDERLAELERDRGRLPGTRYLRARAALLRGEEAPRSVAEALSALADEEKGFHEAALGAARTWLAAGEDAHARYFARRLANDTTANESERLIALEILDSTSGTARSHVPPPTEAARAEIPYIMASRVPLFPTLGDVPPPEGIPPGPSVSPPRPSASPPDYTMPPRGGMVIRYEPELVESLSLPLGASESALSVNTTPTTALEARIAMTRLARDLARDYRLWYGKSLRCNVLAVDAMQQHLTHRFAGRSISEPAVAWELRRHGALLSEIIARALGGDWVDVAPTEPGYWAMLSPPSTRSWPIGRVYRFVALGHRERDLVSYYLDLEIRAQQATR